VLYTFLNFARVDTIRIEIHIKQASPMKYKTLGRTGLKVSIISLGSTSFGRLPSEEYAIQMVEAALNAGINFIDTGDSYVGGMSEQILGKALKGKRNSVVLATKVGSRTGPGIGDIGLSRKHIMQGIEGSLHRLDTDYVDLYYAHQPDYDTDIDETLRAFDDLIHQGKVRYLACSNYRAWQLCKALWASDIIKVNRFNCIQSPYNLLTRDIEYELLPFCASENLGVTVYNPLAGGLLTGKHDANKPPGEGTVFSSEYLGAIYRERYWSEANFTAVARIKEIAEGHGRSMSQFCLAWVLNNPVITSATMGVSSLEQLENNLPAAEIKLSEEEIKACDEVWSKFRTPRYFYGR
jgi:1-deoxyxylulose-5-phosphate synthase